MSHQLILHASPPWARFNLDGIIKLRQRYMALSYSRDIGEEGRGRPLGLEHVRRYVGDRLAWLHQNIMSEVEMWQSLLSIDPGRHLLLSVGRHEILIYT